MLLQRRGLITWEPSGAYGSPWRVLLYRFPCIWGPLQDSLTLGFLGAEDAQAPDAACHERLEPAYPESLVPLPLTNFA